jgi:SAM-dependent methyltransferase
MSPQLLDYPRYVWQLLQGQRSWMERMASEQRQRDVAAYLDSDQPLRVLDLANGRLRPQYTLLRAAGHQVYGIDLVNRPYQSWKDQAYRVARSLFTWRLGLPRQIANGPTLACGDVGALPYPDASFDLVTSIAAFEHFLDVPSVVAELGRVLRPGGMVWVSIHMFASPSGGHNLSFVEIPVRTVPDGIDPWDHLRKRRLPFSVPLNEWRQAQFLDTFAEHFEIIEHYCTAREGEELLTPAIEAELADYSRDELTCAAFIIVARRRVAAGTT